MPDNAAAGDMPVEPRGGSGIFEGEPDQTGLSQDPNVVVKGDADVIPENGAV